MTLDNQAPNNSVHFADYVVAVIDDRNEAEQAASALREGGFAAEDIVLSAPTPSGTEALEHKQGTVADAPTPAARVLTEEGLDQEEYANERVRGHVIVHVHTPHDEDVERARDVLVAHHAHTLKRVGRWTRENLPEG